MLRAYDFIIDLYSFTCLQSINGNLTKMDHLHNDNKKIPIENEYVKILHITINVRFVEIGIMNDEIHY